MSVEGWTDAELDELTALARSASGGEWFWTHTPTKTVNAAVRWVAKTTRASDSPTIWGVMIGTSDNPQIIAYTGNGPTSESNSAYLTAVQPRNITSLIEQLVYARRQVQDLRTQLDYARARLAQLDDD